MQNVLKILSFCSTYQTSAPFPPPEGKLKSKTVELWHYRLVSEEQMSRYYVVSGVQDLGGRLSPLKAQYQLCLYSVPCDFFMILLRRFCGCTRVCVCILSGQFFMCLFLKTESLKGALGDLEFTMQCRLTLNSRRSTCLCLLNAWTKDVCCHALCHDFREEVYCEESKLIQLQLNVKMVFIIFRLRKWTLKPPLRRTCRMGSQLPVGQTISFSPLKTPRIGEKFAFLSC